MLWTMSGDLQDGSGIVTAFANSGIETFGIKTFLICNSITSTPYHKQVLVLALEILKHRAYKDYVKEVEHNGIMRDHIGEDETDLLFSQEMTFDSWLVKVREEQPQAEYYSMCQEMDLLILELIRCCRVSDLDKFVQVPTMLIPYVFALDHLHYARNLPVFLRDLVSLKERHPSLYAELKQNGNFMGRKTNHRFSSMPIDQATEQEICWLKNEGGVIGNLDNPQTVRRHQASIPEMIRILKEFEETKEYDDDRHHEMYPKFQDDFKINVMSLVDAFEKLGNPWKETSGLLYELIESIVMPDEVVNNVRQLKTIGETKFKRFLDMRINSQEEAFNDTISRTDLILFRKALEIKKPTKSVKSVVSERKRQQARVVDIISAYQAGRNVTALSHESSLLPPSITKDGTMFHGTKSDLIDCVVAKEHKSRTHPDTTCTIIDGAALVRKLKPMSSSTFGEYIENEVKPNILAKFSHADRIDLVFDQYRTDSVKNATRDGRGSGKRRKIDATVKIPGNWKDFLSVSENKTEFFSLISQQLLDSIELPDGKQFFATIRDLCRSTDENSDIDVLSPCSHEEADTRMFVHAFGASLSGHTNILILANDCDVIVLALSSRMQKLWITYSRGTKFSYVAIHEIVESMENARALALPGFHAFTGCDTTSSFKGKGKKTAYATWAGNSMYTHAFLELSGRKLGKEAVKRVFPLLQRFIFDLYGEDGYDVDAARLVMLVNKGKDFEDMPPTSDALYLHALRSTHQSGNIWSILHESVYVEEDLAEWAYIRNGAKGIPEPIYTTKAIISRELPDLGMCGCASGRCKGNCKCKKVSQTCTPLCKCKAMCNSL